MEYNAGSPQVVSRTTYNWDLDTEFPLGVVVNDTVNGADEIYIFNTPWWVTDGVTNIMEVIRSLGLIRRDESVGGLILSSTDTRKIKVTSGTVWNVITEYNFTGIDTNVTGNVNGYWYKVIGGWQQSPLTQFSVTQWNDVNKTSLQTIGNNKYCNVWIYGESNAGNLSVALIYPQNQYNTAAEAEAMQAPTKIPTHISLGGMLLGRFIIKQGVDTPVKTQSAFGTSFSASVVTDHGNLAGLSDDDHPQYWLADGSRAVSNLTASKVVFTDADKKLTSTGIGTSAQFIKGDGSLDSVTYIPSSYLDTDGTLAANSDSKVATQKAVKTYADGLVAGLLDYRGAYDASGGSYPTTGGSGTGGAIMKGDMWVISVAGTLGGSAIQVGDSIIANVDSPGQTASNWNTLSSNISYVPEDSANKVTSISGSSTDVQYPSAKLLYDQLALKDSVLSFSYPLSRATNTVSFGYNSTT